MLKGEKRLIEAHHESVTVETVGAALRQLMPAGEVDYSLLRFDKIDLTDLNKLDPMLFEELDLWQMDELSERLKVLADTPPFQPTLIKAISDSLMVAYQKAFQPYPTFWVSRRRLARNN
jgi:hypothetical protein